MFDFKINNNEWTIKLVNKKDITDRYNKDLDEDAKCIFGLTIYTSQEIWINKDMCKDQQIKTLKHELTHCYIHEYGLSYVPNFNEEMVCDLVSSIYQFIAETIYNYENYKDVDISLKE